MDAERNDRDGADWRFLSAVPRIEWPALPAAESAAAAALFLQLERSQWLPAHRLAERRDAQLDALLRFAYDTVPYYRQSFGFRPDARRLEELPLLRRADLQRHASALFSHDVPAGHGAMAESRTSGSTGTPVRVLKTALLGAFWRALTLRDHAWHRRQLAGSLAVIRKGAGRGSQPSWGPATAGWVETGPCMLLDVDADTGTQLEWLRRHDPDYLLTYPSLAAELARLALRERLPARRLREVRTFGEILPPEVRDLCREAWGVPIVDLYSAEEVGYIALQCPSGEHYHVQAESVHVEVLDDAGRACAPGEVGRVVVTDLHNFATPLVRYEIGDYAEAGSRCSCGRGLPVLRRVIGRARNMLVDSAGRRYWPSLGVRAFAEIAPVLQHQFVQAAPGLIEARLVTATPLTAAQEQALRERILSRLPAGFRVLFVPCERIERGPGGKYEDFVSHVDRA